MRRFWLGLIFLALISSASHAEPGPGARQLWIALQYSTVQDRRIDWPWIRRQCAEDGVLKAQEVLPSPAKGIIVPVFADGMCLFETQTVPFQGRNSEAAADERMLKSFLKRAQQAKVPIYLGFRVLKWEDNPAEHGEGVGQAPSIFAKFPEYKEHTANKEADTGISYASPFHPQVRAALEALVSEVAGKFPEAAGIALDVTLSPREVSGFSDAARTAAIEAIHLDPVDLNLQATETGSKWDYRWGAWRTEVMTQLVKTLSGTYKERSQGKRVLLVGSVEYYIQKYRFDLRSSQDWRLWMQSGLGDAAIVSGHWGQNSADPLYFLDSLEELNPDPAKPAAVMPMLGAYATPFGSGAGEEWETLHLRVPDLTEAVVVIGDDDGLKRLAAWQARTP